MIRSRVEVEYAAELQRALAGDYNKLPLRMPDRMRDFLEHLLTIDTAVRQIDGLRDSQDVMWSNDGKACRSGNSADRTD